MAVEGIRSTFSSEHETIGMFSVLRFLELGLQHYQSSNDLVLVRPSGCSWRSLVDGAEALETFKSF